MFFLPSKLLRVKTIYSCSELGFLVLDKSLCLWMCFLTNSNVLRFYSACTLFSSYWNGRHFRKWETLFLKLWWNLGFNCVVKAIDVCQALRIFFYSCTRYSFRKWVNYQSLYKTLCINAYRLWISGSLLLYSMFILSCDLCQHGLN